MTAPPRARHRAPPLWARLNQSARNWVWLIAGGAVVGVVCSTVGIADSVGDEITPVVRADVVALPSRAEEPTGRGGPLAPIFADVDAPQYEPEPPYAPLSPASVNTGQGQRVAVQRSAAATTGPARPVPVAPTTTPEPVPPAPAQPEPVVGLPVIEPTEPAAPVDQPIEEEPPVTETPPETPPVVVDVPTGTEQPLTEEVP